LKNKEPSPDLFKVIFRAGRWKMKSERHFVAFTVDQAVVDFYHTFNMGHIHAKRVKIFNVRKYNRYSGRWENVIDKITNLPEAQQEICWKKQPNVCID